ncbi:hypothetical protein VCUG_02548 [Vavraia culicis subsp. floridensis]|uniref:Uncharacterized protein n=1 Tax=Vavraia culicis (isolate floridensis) TaxID=948595 RepID=L2GRQ5_VAVCU|nr:uncharacterized protein VCUG_02548 [Vavraia culicis subsp. floridensis]ELA45958.1 hypothetical protein VCUG_02548 [Vavraia culicis subsp. floridensis]
MKMLAILSLCSCTCWNGSLDKKEIEETGETNATRGDNSCNIEELNRMYLDGMDVDERYDVEEHLPTEDIPVLTADDVLNIVRMSETDIQTDELSSCSDETSTTKHSGQAYESNILELISRLEQEREEEQIMPVQHANSIGSIVGACTAVSQAMITACVGESQRREQDASLLLDQALHPGQVNSPCCGSTNSPNPARLTGLRGGEKADDSSILALQRITCFMKSDLHYGQSLSSLLNACISPNAVPDGEQPNNAYRQRSNQETQECTRAKSFDWRVFEHARQVQDIMHARLECFNYLCRLLDIIKRITTQDHFKILFETGHLIEALCESYNGLKREVYIFLHFFLNFNYNIMMFNTLMIFTFENMHSDTSQRHKNIIFTFRNTMLDLRIKVLTIANHILSIRKAVNDGMKTFLENNVTNGTSTSVQMPKWQQTEGVATIGRNIGINRRREPSYSVFFKTAYNSIHEMKKENVRLLDATIYLILLLTYDGDPST